MAQMFSMEEHLALGKPAWMHKDFRYAPRPEVVIPPTPEHVNYEQMREFLTQGLAHDRIRIVSYEPRYTSKELRALLQDYI